MGFPICISEFGIGLGLGWVWVESLGWFWVGFGLGLVWVWVWFESPIRGFLSQYSWKFGIHPLWVKSGKVGLKVQFLEELKIIILFMKLIIHIPLSGCYVPVKEDESEDENENEEEQIIGNLPTRKEVWESLLTYCDISVDDISL